MRIGQVTDVGSFLLLVLAGLCAILRFPSRRCGCTLPACRACFRSNGCCPAADYDTRDW